MPVGGARAYIDHTFRTAQAKFLPSLQRIPRPTHSQVAQVMQHPLFAEENITYTRRRQDGRHEPNQRHAWLSCPEP